MPRLAQVGFELSALDNASKALNNASKQMAKLSAQMKAFTEQTKASAQANDSLKTSNNAIAATAKKASAEEAKLASSQQKASDAAKQQTAANANLTSRLNVMGKAAQRAFFIYETGVRMLRVAKAAFVDPFLEAGKAAADFQLKLAEINTLFDSTIKNSSDRTKQLGTDIVDLSVKYGQDLLKTGDAAYNAVSAGAVDSAAAQAVLTNATKLATVGLVDTSVAMKALTTVSNSFGRSVQTSEHVADLLFTTVQKGVTTMGELAPKIGRVAGIAGSAGMSMEAMFAVLAAGTKVTGLTSVAVTGLRSAINQMLNPGEKAQRMLDTVNKRLETGKIRFGTSATEGAGMITVLKNMANAFKQGKLSADELSVIIPNARAQAVVLGILKEGANDVQKIFKLMNDRLKVQGVVTQKAAEMMKTATKQQARYKSSLQATRTELGKMFTASGAMGGFFKGLADGFDDLRYAFQVTNSNLDDQADSFEKVGKFIAVIVGIIVSSLKVIISFVMGVVDVFLSLQEVVQTVFMTIGDSLASLASILGTQLAAALGQTALKISPKLASFFDVTPASVKRLKKAAKEQTKALGENFKVQFDFIMEKIGREAGEKLWMPLFKPAADFATEVGILLGKPFMDLELAKNRFFEIKADDTKKTKKGLGDVGKVAKATGKDLKFARGLLSEALAGTQEDFQGLLSPTFFDRFLQAAGAPGGFAGAVTSGAQALLSQQEELKNLQFMVGDAFSEEKFAFPEVPKAGLKDMSDLIGGALKRLRDGTTALAQPKEVLIAFLQQTAAFGPIATEQLERFIDVVMRLKPDQFRDLIEGSLQGATDILQKNVDDAISGEQLIAKEKKRLSDSNFKRVQDVENKFDKMNKKRRKKGAKDEQKRLKEITRAAQEYASIATGVLMKFSNDLFDSTKSIGEAFIGLFDTVLELIQRTLTEFLLAEGLKQLMLETTANTAVSTNITKQASDTTTAVSSLQKSAAVAGGKVTAYSAGFGPFGLILAGILAPIFIGMIRSYLGKITSAEGKARGGPIVNYLASGGLVHMQPRGTDTVPAMLTPGEFVLSKPIVDSIRQGRSPSSTHFATGGMVPASASMPTVASPSMNIQMQTFAVPSKAQFRRWYKSSVAPNRRVMKQRGQI